MITHLNQTVIHITGDDTTSFLQGLISQDVNLLESSPLLYSAFLTPQGKFLYDFFIQKTDDGVFLDIEKSWAETLLKKLKIYKLRSKVDLTLRNDLSVYALWDGETSNHAFNDPRLAEMGMRLITEENLETSATEEDYHKHRINLGVPDGFCDLVQEKTTLLEAGFDDLNGVSFDKGCYLGQELTARTKYRGLIRKKMLIIESDQALPAKAEKLNAHGKNMGEMLGSIGQKGLALIRIESFYKTPEFQDDNGQKFTLTKPGFLTLPDLDEITVK